MDLEIQRQEILGVWRVVDGKDREIAKLEVRHTEDMHLVNYMRKKIGIPNFTICEIGVQTSI